MPRSYTDYPAEYADLFMRFRREGRAIVPDLSHASARTIRWDLNRYRAALRAAMREDASDSHTRALFEAARDATLRIEPSLREDGLYSVTISLNPLVAAVRSANKPP